MGIETIVFPYSKIVGWTGVLFFLSFIAAFLNIGLNTDDANLWYTIAAILAVITALMVYFIWRCLVPAIKNQPALILGSKKLTFHPTDRVIYWKDVIEISYDRTRCSRFLSFDLLPDGKNIGLGLAWIAGNNKDIYKAVQAYFEESLKEDGQLDYAADNDDI